MTAFILAILIVIVGLLIIVMIKLSELNGRLVSLETTTDSINTKVDALLASTGDPAIPADAEATIVRLDSKLAAIDAKLPTPAP